MSEAVGDCYQAAIGGAARFGWDVVHGTVVGTGGTVKGQRYDHAWNELPPASYAGRVIGEAIVFDVSQGKEPRPLSAGFYYALGKVQVAARYTASEAIEKALDTEHYGPWHEDNETAAIGQED